MEWRASADGMRGFSAVRALLGMLAVFALALPAEAGATFAPLDRPGPKLSVSKAKLRASLTCQGLAGARVRPVLLVHGTNVTARENWSHFYIPALKRRGVPHCTVQMPQRATGDIQVNAEYVVHAIRAMFRRAGRERIAIIGASQGGMVPRWALRFWPDTRRKVDDLVGLAPSNHGTTGYCGDTCIPAGWQQTAGSRFMRALNSRTETFRGISYTNIYTHFDQTVVPNSDDRGSSSLHRGKGKITNVAIQDVCPLAVSEHLLTGFFDPTAFQLAMDALEHPGPADPVRVARRGCLQEGAPADLNHAVEDLLNALVLRPGIAPAADREPPLRRYTRR